MNMSALSTTELALIIALVVIVAGGIATCLFLRKRRTARLRTQFGDPEYARAVQEGGTSVARKPGSKSALNGWRVSKSERLLQATTHGC